MMKIKKILNNISLSIITLVGVTIVTACGHKKSQPPPPAPPISGIYSPFIDVTTLQGSDKGRYSNLINYYMNPGVRHMMLGFVQQGSAYQVPHAQWAGTIEIDSSNKTTAASATYIKNSIDRFQSVGGDVCVSFGGSGGVSEWTLATATPTNLANDILRVANYFKTKKVDFDIEGGVVANVAANKKLASACAQILVKDPSFRFSLTLPVLRTGLTIGMNGGLQLLRNFYDILHKNIIVNIMAMDYGGVITDMDQAAEDASEATVAQISLIYKISTEAAYKLLGVTPMIGYNDVKGEVMSLKQYSNVATYLRNKKAFMYGMWSLNRDYAAKTEGAGGPKSSGLLPAEAPNLSFSKSGLENFGDKGGPTSPVSGNINLEQYLITQRDFGAYWTEVKNVLRYKIIVDNNSANPYYSMANNLILETSKPTSQKHTFKIEAIGINNSEVDSETITVDNSGAETKSLITMFQAGVPYITDRIFIYQNTVYRVKHWYQSGSVGSKGTKQDLPNVEAAKADGALEIDPKLNVNNLVDNGYSARAVTDLENNQVWNIVNIDAKN